MELPEIRVVPDAEGELVGRGESVGSCIRAFAVGSWICAAILFALAAIAMRGADDMRTIALFAGFVFCAFLGSLLYVFGQWIRTYSWVVARSSAALRKLTENRGD